MTTWHQSDSVSRWSKNTRIAKSLYGSSTAKFRPKFRFRTEEKEERSERLKGRNGKEKEGKRMMSRGEIDADIFEMISFEMIFGTSCTCK